MQFEHLCIVSALIGLLTARVQTASNRVRNAFAFFFQPSVILHLKLTLYVVFPRVLAGRVSFVKKAWK